MSKGMQPRFSAPRLLALVGRPKPENPLSLVFYATD
jgi:hypothetical protein